MLASQNLVRGLGLAARSLQKLNYSPEDLRVLILAFHQLQVISIDEMALRCRVPWHICARWIDGKRDVPVSYRARILRYMSDAAQHLEELAGSEAWNRQQDFKLGVCPRWREKEQPHGGA